MSFASTAQRRPAPRPVPVPKAPPRPGIDPAVQGLINIIQTLETVVEEETAALAARTQVDLESYSNRKSQGLMELNRASRTLEAMANHQVVAARLSGLRDKLSVNQMALKMHLDAVREISSIVANAIRESESDGTYSESIRSPTAGYGYD
ncbi:MAG: hypothetical protein NW223_09465 [Hyphomicrobiaceae bacterium]|nr:hypothetical protein [Hyphomicrobiaceae bacterium]